MAGKALALVDQLVKLMEEIAESFPFDEARYFQLNKLLEGASIDADIAKSTNIITEMYADWVHMGSRYKSARDWYAFESLSLKEVAELLKTIKRKHNLEP